MARQRHTREHVRFQRDRWIARRLRMGHEFGYCKESWIYGGEDLSLDPTQWWGQHGRLNKYPHGCDHFICTYYAMETSFAFHKRKFYRALDRHEDAKW